jgi:outer membrane protein assembly factor BamB
VARWDVLAGQRVGAEEATGPLTGFCTSEEPDAPRAIARDNGMDPWNTLVVASAEGWIQDLPCRGPRLGFGQALPGPLATNGGAACVGKGAGIELVELFGSNNRCTFSGHVAQVTHLSWGRALVSGDAQGTVKAWRSNTAECLATFELGSPTVGVAIRGTRAFAAGRDGALLRFDLPEGGDTNFLAAAPGVRVSGGFRGVVTVTRGDAAPVRSQGGNTWRSWYALTPDARQLACRGKPGTLELWDLETGHRTLLPLGTDEEPGAPAFGPGGLLLVGVSRDEQTRCFALPDTSIGRRVDGGFCAAASTCGNWMATSSYRGAKVRLFHAGTGRKAWEQKATSPAVALRFTGDGRQLLAALQDALVALDVASGRELWQWPLARRLLPCDAGMHPNRLREWAPLGADLVACAEGEGELCVLQAATGAVLRRGPVLGSMPVVAAGHGAQVAVGTLGQRVLVLDRDGDVRLDVTLQETPVALAFGDESTLHVATSAGRELALAVPPHG